MARFFALGPLVLILRMVLYVSADQSTNPTPPTAYTHALPTTAGSASNQKETQRSTSISPRRTAIQQQNTETTASASNQEETQTSTSISPTRTAIQQQKPDNTESTSDQKETQTSTSISPTHTTIQQKNSETTVHQSNSSTPITSTNTSADTSTKVPQSNISTLITSSNTSADIIKETAPSPPRTPTQTSLSTDKDTLPGSSNDSITSPPNTTITSLTSTQTTSTLHTSTSITETAPSPSHTQTQTSLSPDLDTQPGSSNDSITSPPNTLITSLTSTQPTSTLHTSTSITGTTEEPCQYSVLESVKEKEAHVVNINGSKDQIYTIRIKEKHNEIRAEQISNQTAFKIPFEWLKPCTVYTVSVDDCKLSGNNTFTSSKNGETVPKTVVTSVTDNEVCLKGELTGIQWDLTECVEITEQNSCASTHTVVLDTCNYTMNVALPPVKLHINFKETIPSQFEWMNKPERCNAALLNINCTNNENKNGTVYGLNTPVLLLPNTNYTCTGEYPLEKQPIKSHELDIQIKCDWKKNGRFQQRTNISLEISWTSLEGDRCSGIEWDSYSASCKTPDRHGNNHRVSCTQDSGTSTVCSITGLLPYTDYECSIIGKVNQKDYVIYTGNSTTLSGKPVFKTKTKVTFPSQNSLEINCEKMERDLIWNGGKGTFTAEIRYSGYTKTSGPQNKCLFRFSDLYSLATYDVKITAMNTEGHSAETTTKCHNKLTKNGDKTTDQECNVMEKYCLNQYTIITE
ncbi:receptor-type tyrosine-protein phosphatase C-like [Carassius gibelio]|uniref:receptor-type tyrosine-protein phosphatase C-like n=1 Tax=Carassius gibelio TaxID=101364 RepID=UPI00227779C9|nr:receptor-type tyrosine-protein phosphatase C-like [Carassius gibelio]